MIISSISIFTVFSFSSHELIWSSYAKLSFRKLEIRQFFATFASSNTAAQHLYLCLNVVVVVTCNLNIGVDCIGLQAGEVCALEGCQISELLAVNAFDFVCENVWDQPTSSPKIFVALISNECSKDCGKDTRNSEDQGGKSDFVTL